MLLIYLLLTHLFWIWLLNVIDISVDIDVYIRFMHRATVKARTPGISSMF